MRDALGIKKKGVDGMLYFDTESFTGEYRISENNGVKGFNKCEVCGANEPLEAVNIRYCHRYKKVMCDRCIDNFDNITPWSDKHAKEFRLPPFPLVNSHER